MAKGWFRFSRSSRSHTPPQDAQEEQTTKPQEEAPAPASQNASQTDISPEPATTEEATPIVAEEVSAATTAEEPADAAAPATVEEPAPTAEEVEEPAEAEPASLAEEEPTQPSAPTAAVTLSLGAEMPSYVDAQSAGDWLAMLSQISAVTAYKRLSYDLLDLKAGERAVDVGCGLGQDARELARRVGPTGSVVGVDGSEEMITRATAATDAESARTLRFIAGDAMALPLETGAFDALRADRLLQHVEDPLRALLEFRRVLRPGARLVLIEPDWKTMAVYPGSAAGGDDDRISAAIFDWQVAHTNHPLIGRQLRMLLTQAGFVSIAVTPVAYASTHFMEADLTLELTRAATGAAEQWPARLSAADAQAWRVTAQAADAAGHFFASVPLFFAHAIVE